MPIKRSPMKAGTKPMKRGVPMNRGTSQLARAAKPMRARSKTNAKRESGGEDKLCRGQPCYLLLPGIARHDSATVVPCHSNQIMHGKGKGIKAYDCYTVPGCAACHRELDAGMRFTKAEKFAFWDDAFARWRPVRERLYNTSPSPLEPT